MSLKVYTNPYGNVFFWEQTQPFPMGKCGLKSKKAGCPRGVERAQAEKIISELCKAYPKSVYCLGGKACPLLKKRPGLITNIEGEGVGIITKGGMVKKLPSPIPEEVVKIAEEEKTISVVQPLEDGDEEALDVISEVLTGGVIAGVKQTTAREENALLSAIQKGVVLKKAGGRGSVKKCDVGLYWSNRLGRCVVIDASAKKDVNIAELLQQKFAGARGDFEKSVRRWEEEGKEPGEDDEWWEK